MVDRVTDVTYYIKKTFNIHSKQVPYRTHTTIGYKLPLTCTFPIAQQKAEA